MFLRDPVVEVIDRSTLVDSPQDSDIETKEEIRVVFPDGTIETGGCPDGETFDMVIAELKSKCSTTTPFLTSKPSTKILRDYEKENLMKAFPKQFPYGIGYHRDFNIQAAQNGYLKHLLSLSIPGFHESAFVLVIHNIFERSKALTGALWQVMGGYETCNVTEEELNTAIMYQQKGLPPPGGPGDNFLKSIKLVKTRMSHTNEAAAAAQAKFISLTHHFGCAKALFTVSFDDSLDIRILTLAGKVDTINWINQLFTLPPTEVATNMDLLDAVRTSYPGLCALNFEYLLDIVLDKLVGDNPSKQGIFGIMEAFGLATEEQGRKTLHAHILVFVKGWNRILRDLQSNTPRVKKRAGREVIQFTDSVLSTALTPGSPEKLSCFSCGARNALQYVSQQQMRDLRHQLGCRVQQGILAQCQECKTSFQADELALKRCLPPQLWTLPIHEVKAKVALDVLASTSPLQQTPSHQTVGLVNYRFNHHLQYHTKTCFKKGKEARCNLPDFEESKTRLLYSAEPYELFDWTGRLRPMHNISIRPKRLPQDAYTNQYCKAISASKAPCNSNIGITVGSRATIYASCYSAKATQKEDSEAYKRMVSYVGNRFLEERKDTALFEGLSRLMGSVIVATSQHVCAAPMAAYLVRNQSRFKFSHNLKYIPIREVVELICHPANRMQLKMSVMPHTRGCFLTNEALHYLHRPRSATFQYLSLYDFFLTYEVVRNGSGTMGDDNVTFDIDDPDHPGFTKQYIRQRNMKNQVLPQFCHWIFPDSATFGGNILTMTQYPVPPSVENFCRLVLVLFHPCRTFPDITIDGSFHKKFMSVFPRGHLPPIAANIIPNIQLYYDSLKLPANDDPLRACTVAFHVPGDTAQDSSDEEGEEDTDPFDMLAMFHPRTPLPESPFDTEGSSSLMQVLLQPLRQLGARGCGFYHLPSFTNYQPSLPITNDQTKSLRGIPLSFISNTPSNSGHHQTTPTGQVLNTRRDKPFVSQLMYLTYEHTKRRLQRDNNQGSGPIAVEATGTVLS
ncbi:MAG: hypothetical protein ACRCZI_13975, partial [Cetobacterium sp.]